MTLSEKTAFIAALGSFLGPVLAFVGWCSLAWWRRRHEAALSARCPACAARSAEFAPPRPMGMLLIMGGAYLLSWAAHWQSMAIVATTHSAAPALAKGCGTECTKKANCACVNENCRCGAASRACAPETPPEKKPSSALIAKLPPMAGEVDGSWLAPISSGPLSRDL